MTIPEVQKMFGPIPEKRFVPIMTLVSAASLLCGLSVLLTKNPVVHGATNVGFLSAMLVWARAVRAAPFLQWILGTLILMTMVIVAALAVRSH